MRVSTALNEIGYPKVWVDAQLSHADPGNISSAYNHAQYIERRWTMTQDWANCLDLYADAGESCSSGEAPSNPRSAT
jgi:hypothetical protein